ncbi:MAG: hypothetical protein AB7K37_09885 [Cyclobacteriaceae bacterium]
MAAIRFLICALLFSSCVQLNELGCPTPDRVKLRKHYISKARYTKAKRHQVAAERAALASKDYSRDGLKELKYLEEWDCPRPGTKHSKLIQANRKRIEKRYQEALRKREKDSKELTQQGLLPEESNN